MNEFLNTPIEFLKGVGPNRAELLKKEAGIFTFNDLQEQILNGQNNANYLTKKSESVVNLA